VSRLARPKPRCLPFGPEPFGPELMAEGLMAEGLTAEGLTAEGLTAEGHRGPGAADRPCSGRHRANPAIDP